jgi:hypothetical protein
MKYSLVFVCLFVNFLAFGQLRFDELLDTAMQQYKRKAFGEVVATIRPTLLPVSKQARMPEALFLSASAAIQAKDYSSAALGFQVFHEHFPSFNTSSEWILLETDWCLSRKKWSKALSVASTAENWMEDDAMSNLFLNKCQTTPTDSLKIWLAKYPTWPVANWLMAQQMLAKNASNPSIDPLKRKAWKSWNQKLSVGFDSSTWNSSKYKIGMLLPLELPQIKHSDHNRKNQALLNFITGFRMACDAQSKNDTSFTAYIYDYQRSETKLNSLLSEPEMRGMNALVGPVLPMAINNIQQFAINSNIPVVNPLGFGVNFSGTLAPCYQLAATPQALAQSALQFANSKPNISKAMVVFGTSLKDSLIAAHFKLKFTQHGGKISLFKRVGKNTAANLVKYLSEAGIDSNTFVFVPNNEPLVQVQLLATMGLLQKRPIVLVPLEWLKSPAADYAQLELQSIAFIGQYPKSEGFFENAQFREKFHEKTGLPASTEAWWGFEVGTALCQELAKGRKSSFYQPHGSDTPYADEPKAMFQKRGDFRHFPIIQLIDGLPETVSY